MGNGMSGGADVPVPTARAIQHTHIADLPKEDNIIDFHDVPDANGEGESGGKILNVFHPMFNLRRCAQEMILLEHHLMIPRFRCPDCIRKHMFAIEAYADEGITLDPLSKLVPLFARVAEGVRRLQYAYHNKKLSPEEIARILRRWRKRLVKITFGFPLGG